MTEHLPTIDLSLLTSSASLNVSAPAPTFNENEMISVLSLIAYVSHTQRTSATEVQEVLVARFGVEQITDIKRPDYEEVIRFLVDLCTDMTMN